MIKSSGGLAALMSWGVGREAWKISRSAGMLGEGAGGRLPSVARQSLPTTGFWRLLFTSVQTVVRVRGMSCCEIGRAVLSA